MTEEEIRASERQRIAQRIELAAARYQAQMGDCLYVRGVRRAAALAARDTPVVPRLALVKTS